MNTTIYKYFWGVMFELISEKRVLTRVRGRLSKVGVVAEMERKESRIEESKESTRLLPTLVFLYLEKEIYSLSSASLSSSPSLSSASISNIPFGPPLLPSPSSESSSESSCKASENKGTERNKERVSD